VRASLLNTRSSTSARPSRRSAVGNSAACQASATGGFVTAWKKGASRIVPQTSSAMCMQAP